MARNGIEKSEPVTETEPKQQPEGPSNQQDWKPILVHLGSGGGVTGMCYAVSRLFSEPQDGWIIALGIAVAIITTGVIIHDVYPAKTPTIKVFCTLTIFALLLSIGQWTEVVWDRQASQTAPSQQPVVQQAEPVPAVAQPQLHPPRFHEDISSLTFTLGTGGFSGTNILSGIPFYLGGYIPFALYRRGDGSLGVNVKVWGGRGVSAPIEIKGDDFVVRPANWDRNMNDNALEVVDSQGKPVFQLIQLTPGHVLVNGIFPLPNGGFLLAGDNGSMMRTGKYATIPPDFTITPIFRYPSWKYPGIYAKP